MRKLLLALLIGTLWGQSYYPKAYTGSTTLQAGPPPFTALTPAGTIKTAPAPYNSQIVRLTDPATASCATFVTPGNGDATSIPFSPGELLFDAVCSGGHYIESFNPATMQPGKKLFTCNGEGTFSTVSQVFYCQKGTGVWATWMNGTAVTSSLVFDWGKCPQAGSGLPSWTSYLSVTAGDTLFTEALGWKQGQDVAHLVFLYSTTTRSCVVLDTLGDGVTPIYYYGSSSFPVMNLLTGKPLACVSPVHSTRHSSGWLVVGQGGIAKGPDCNKISGAAFLLRLSDMEGYSTAVLPFAGGHGTISPVALYNSPNPPIAYRLMQTPYIVSVMAKVPHPGEDIHIAADQSNDNTPLIGSTGGLETTTWLGPYMNEVLGIEKNGTVYRFSPCWTSKAGYSNFEAGACITGVSQERDMIMFTSDMMCSLGGKPPSCRADVFAVKIVKNGQ